MESAGGEAAAVGGMDVGASVAALGPAFGLIGADFVQVFGAAQTAHSTSIEKLATVLRASGQTAGAIAAIYDDHEDEHSAELRRTAEAVL